MVLVFGESILTGAIFAMLSLFLFDLSFNETISIFLIVGVLSWLVDYHLEKEKEKMNNDN